MILGSCPQPSVVVKGSIDSVGRPAELSTLCRELRRVNDAGQSRNNRCRSRNSRPHPEARALTGINLKSRLRVLAGFTACLRRPAQFPTAALTPAASSTAVAGSEALDGSVPVELAPGGAVPGANPAAGRS